MLDAFGLQEAVARSSTRSNLSQFYILALNFNDNRNQNSHRQPFVLSTLTSSSLIYETMNITLNCEVSFY